MAVLGAAKITERDTVATKIIFRMSNLAEPR
jgi:hypothetical protein